MPSLLKKKIRRQNIKGKRIKYFLVENLLDTSSQISRQAFHVFKLIHQKLYYATLFSWRNLHLQVWCCCNNMFCRENLLVLLFYVLFSDQTVQWKQYLQARSKNVDKTQNKSWKESLTFRQQSYRCYWK